MLIATLFDEAEIHGDALGTLPPIEEARRIFVDAQLQAPDAIDELLLNPQVGGWAAYVMRRWRGMTRGCPPLWVDFGGLHVLSLLAAARAGLTWRTRLPHRQGRLLLFGMGMAEFSDIHADDLIDAESYAGRITLAARNSRIEIFEGEPVKQPQWREARGISVGGDLELHVCLDDLDPFRDLADPIPPEPLDDAAASRWQKLLDEAWSILCDHHRETAEAVSVGVVSLVPLPIGDARETRSASSGESFGRVMVSPPPDAVTLAVAIVHEFQHIKLGGLMHLTRLTIGDEISCLYAPWRDDPRPIGGLLQGVYAFFGIAAFWRRQRGAESGADRRLADFEYAYARSQAREGISGVRESDSLTDEGCALIDGLSACLEAWLSDVLDPMATAAMRIVADYHRAGWRIRHQVVNDGDIDMLEAAWHDGRPAVLRTERPRVVPALPIRWSYRMIELARRRILASDTPVDSERVSTRLEREIHDADLALFDGECDTAAKLYAGAVREECADLDAWAGLAVAADMCGLDAASRALRRRPEIVRALYFKLTDSNPAVDPIRIAGWLGGAVLDH